MNRYVNNKFSNQYKVCATLFLSVCGFVNIDLFRDTLLQVNVSSWGLVGAPSFMLANNFDQSSLLSCIRLLVFIAHTVSFCVCMAACLDTAQAVDATLW